MILKKEIERAAEAHKVAKETIDKDWVLGHFIDSIFSIDECRENLVFKGGTCLRKCYFKDYRFSEDLDFTAVNSSFILDRKLLQKIADQINIRTEIPLYIQVPKKLQYKNKPTGFSATVKFWGADHNRNQPPPPPNRWNTSIKIEIISYEKMVFNTDYRQVHHPYSDDLSDAAQSVPCYSLQEVLAEKFRALIQRSYTAPRDFYDIWFLSQHMTNPDWKEIVRAFHQKMQFKGLEFKGIEQLINNHDDKNVRNAWNSSLKHQIPWDKFETYDTVKPQLKALFMEIF